MKGYKFYLEYESNKSKRQATRKNLGNHTGNCLAVFTDIKPFLSHTDWNYECFGGMYFTPNSPVAHTSCSHDYLRMNCKRISAKQAFEIHPEMKKYIDYINLDIK